MGTILGFYRDYDGLYRNYFSVTSSSLKIFELILYQCLDVEFIMYGIFFI